MTTALNYQILESPIGPLRLVSNGSALVRIEFPERHASDGECRTDSVLECARQQLTEYFEGRRRSFSVPLASTGTAFQQRTWNALSAIPFGELRSYRDIASAIGNVKAVRAVGSANGRNPIPIIVPCHRVIGSDGSLTGFGGGIDVKRRLLELEGVELRR